MLKTLMERNKYLIRIKKIDTKINEYVSHIQDKLYHSFYTSKIIHRNYVIKIFSNS